MGTTARQIGTATAWSVISRVGRFALGMASSVIVVRTLGPHDYGVLSLIRTLLMLTVVVSGLGMGHAVLKFMPALRVAGSRAEANRLVRRVLAVNVGAWALLSALCWLGQDWLEARFSFEGLGVLLAAAVALSLFESLYARLSQMLFSAYDARTQSIGGLASHVVYIVLLAVLLPRGYGVIGVIVSAAAGYLVACVLVIRGLRQSLRFKAGDTGESIAIARLMRYSLPMALIGLLNMIVWRQSETVLLSYFRTAEETGFFDIAYRLPQTILEFVPATIWPLVMAGVSEAYARNTESLARAVDRYYRMLFLMCAPVCTVGLVMGGQMVTVLFGAQNLPAAVPAQVFFAIFTVSFFSTPLSMALLVMEKTHVNLIIYVVLAIVNIGLDLLLIPRYGVVGAMIPVGVVIALQPPLYRIALSREVDGVKIPFRFIARCFLASSPVLLLWPAMRFVDSAYTLAGAGLVAFALVIVSFRVMRVIGPAESEILRSIPAPFVGRLLKFICP